MNTTPSQGSVAAGTPAGRRCPLHPAPGPGGWWWGEGGGEADIQRQSPPSQAAGEGRGCFFTTTRRFGGWWEAHWSGPLTWAVLARPRLQSPPASWSRPGAWALGPRPYPPGQARPRNPAQTCREKGDRRWPPCHRQRSRSEGSFRPTEDGCVGAVGPLPGLSLRWSRQSSVRPWALTPGSAHPRPGGAAQERGLVWALPPASSSGVGSGGQIFALLCGSCSECWIWTELSRATHTTFLKKSPGVQVREQEVT